MAGKISDLTQLTNPSTSATYVEALDTTDTSEAPTGTNKKMLLSSTGYSPATKVVAPAGSGFIADYYTTGTADETQINLAITAVNGLGGGVVLIKSGNYSVASPITPLTNVIIRGEGLGTYVKLPNLTNVNIFEVFGVNHVIIEDLYLDGNGVNQSVEKQIIRIGQGSTYIDVKNCKLINASHHGVNSLNDSSYSNCTNIRVLYCEISNCGSLVEANPDGACIALQGSYCLAQGNFITDTSFCGIELYHDGDHSSAVNNFIIWNGESDTLGAIQVGVNNENSIVSGNIITGAGVSGHGAIKVLANYATVSNNTIFDITNGFGIWASGTNNSAFNNNTIKNLSQEGIYIEGTYNTFSANTITNCLMGINARPTAFYDVIIGNIISGNQQYGIFVNQSAKNITINSNQIINNSQSSTNTYDGINSQGANITILGNQCYDNQGSPTQKYGIRVQNSSSVNFSVIGNWTSGNATGGIQLFNTGTNYIFSENKGDDNITLDGNASRGISLTNATSGGGNQLTLQSGGAQSSGLNLASGVLNLSTAQSTGNGRGDIHFSTTQAGSSGISNNSPALTAILTGNGPTKLILDNTTTDTQNGINISGNSTQELYHKRITTANTSGKNFTIQAGGATSQATNKNGGNLILASGIATGSGTSQIQFQTASASNGATGTLQSISINNRGSAYLANDVLTITGGGGNATATVNTVAPAGQISTVAINSGGTGYVANDVLTLSGGSGGTITVNVVDANGVILLSTLTTGGSGYTAGSNQATTGGTGTGATFNTTIFSTGAILTISLTAIGTGYSLATNVSTTGGTGSSATLNIVPFDNADNALTTRMTLNNIGNLVMTSNNITTLSDPVNAQDAATKNYVDKTIQTQDLSLILAFAGM